MTRPAPHKRSTAAQRRQWRAEFKVLKAWCAEHGEETLKARERKREAMRRYRGEPEGRSR
jgi:hypothetical protein